jgi:hypothetical protein
MDRPSGVTCIAAIFFLCALYLFFSSFILLVSPQSIPVAFGSPFLYGLKPPGLFTFSLVGACDALIAWGLMRLSRWARRAAILLAGISFFMLVPVVSMAADFRGSLLTSGLGMMLTVVVIWLLLQKPVAEAFEK